ncbi:MAG TPA: DUF6703 family protein [Mycobacteriales bacterium]|nr:DUF6703 family protein [Mycobacteriales bacterium]
MRSSRLVNVLIAIAVGALVLTGLFVHGPVGGILLAVVVVLLLFLSSATWATLPTRGRIARGLVIGAVGALAVVKFAGKA